MVYGITGLSLLFLFLAFVVTESNVSYFVNGFSSLSASQREEVHPAQFVKFFRRFHLILAASFALVCFGLLFFIDENAAGLFLGIYPIMAYIFFLIHSRRYFVVEKNWPMTLSVIILIGSIVLVSVLFFRSLEPNGFEFQEDELVITGTYGMDIPYADILNVEVVSELPPIKRKRHGYATGDILKGEFRTGDGALVRIIADQRLAPFVKVTTAKGKVIYLTSAKYTSSELVEGLIREKEAGR